ncbi:hypothetical protein HDV06_006475 [Boothiomyces sp. JEL0866]|nr:hypothetical protein HDV06_006475 [Boothiomyces sp. JEL0866]
MGLTGSQSTDQAISGFIAGASSTLLMHPFDVLKTKMQVKENSKFGLRNIISSIHRNEGIRGFYRGISPNFVGATVSWGMYFFWYSHLKDMFRTTTTKKLNALEHLTASAGAGITSINSGILTSLATNPVWVVKTRVFTQSPDDSNAYKGVLDGLSKIYKNEGVKGFYRGIIPALFGVSHGAIQFMAYEELKSLYSHDSALKTIGLASVSKLFATLFTYPYQLVKARMQVESKYVEHEYSSVYKSCITIYRNEGTLGFYKGLGVNIARFTNPQPNYFKNSNGCFQ